MDETIAILGFSLAFALYLDNVDLMLNKKVNVTYRAIRTLSIIYLMVVMLHFYFVGGA